MTMRAVDSVYQVPIAETLLTRSGNYSSISPPPKMFEPSHNIPTIAPATTRHLSYYETLAFSAGFAPPGESIPVFLKTWIVKAAN